MKNIEINISALRIAIVALMVMALHGYAAAQVPAEQYSFIQNSGQWPDSVMFSFRSKLGAGFITGNGVYLNLKNHSSRQHEIDGCWARISFAPNYRPALANVRSNSTNYFHGNLSITDVPSGDSLVFFDSETNSITRLYFDGGFLRWDWSIPPEAAGQDFSFTLEGVMPEAIACTPDGIIAETASGSLRIGKIKVYAENETEALPYSVDRTGQNTYSVRVNNSDMNSNLAQYTKKRIIIDPLIYGAFLGGADYDIAHSVACDSLGFAFVAGQTQSLNFPTTLGAYSDSLRRGENVESDIFVTKIDTAGRKILFSTYIGSKASDIGKAIAIAPDGNLIITGYTAESFTFPVTSNVYQTKHAGAWDGFLLKLRNDGKRLIWSTLYGGLKDDFAQGLSLHDSTIYLCGYSLVGSDLPTTMPFHSRDTLRKNDSWAARFSQDGKELISAALFGGKEDDFAQAVAVGDDGDIYTCGFTSSHGFPTSVDAIKSIFADTVAEQTASDAFVTVLSPDCSALVYSTLYGGTCRDGAYSIALRGAKVFIAGTTLSPDFPVTALAYDTAYNRGKGEIYEGDCWVAEFIPGASPIFSTFIGGSSADKVYSIALDDDENIYATGATASKDFPVTRNAIDKSLEDKSNTSDAFMFKMTPDGKTLKYSTYLGGRNEDVANSIALPADRSAIVVGSTASPDFPHTQFAFDTTLNDTSKSDAFALRLLTEQFEVYAGGRVAICSGDTAILGNPAKGGFEPIVYKWWPDYRIFVANNGKCFAYPDTSMYYYVEATDAAGRKCSDSVFVSVSDRVPKWIFGPRYVNPGVIVTYRAIGDGKALHRWHPSNGEVVTDADSSWVKIKWGSEGPASLYLETISPSGCIYRTQAKNITVGSLFRPVIYPPYVEPFCSGGNVVLDAGPDYHDIEWSDGHRGRFDTVSVYGDYWARVTYGTDTVLYSDTIHIEIGEIPEKPSFVILPDSLYCLQTADSYQWYYRNAAIPGGTSRSHRPKYIGYYRVEVINSFGCSNISDSLLVPVLPGVSEKIIQNTKAFPNPSAGLFFVEGSCIGSFACRFSITNCLGETLMDYSKPGMEDFREQIDLRSCPDGVYFLIISAGSSRAYHRLVKLAP